MSSNKQIKELKKMIKSDEKRMNRGEISSPSGDVFVLILIALLASASLAMSIYTYEDNKDKPSSAFTSIGIATTGGTGGGEVVAVGGTALTMVADAGLCITGTDSNKRIEFLNTRSSGTGAPSGPPNSIQFNNSGVFGGNIGLSFNQGTSTLNSANIVTGGLTANSLIYPTSDGSADQFLKTDGSGILTFDTPPSGIGYGVSTEGGLVLNGTSFAAVAGQGIKVSSAGICVKLKTSESNLTLDGTGLGLSPIITGVSFQGNPIDVSYGGTGITTIGTSQFIYGIGNNNFGKIGLCAGTSIGIDFGNEFITIKYTGTGGGGSNGVSELSDLSDAQNGGANFTESVIIGQRAPTGITTGSEKNTAIGLCAIFSLTSGNNNTAIGFDAGKGITTGTSCTFIGASTGITTGISGHNITCLGFGAQPSGLGVTGEITLGDSTIQTLRCADQNIVSLSDGRDKTNIEETQYGLDFLMKLRPVDYTWQRRVLEPSDINHPKNGKRRTGFIAQELLEAAGEDGNNILDLVYQSNPERIEARYGNLIPVLVKSVQDLSNKVAMLEEKIENLQK